MGPRLGIELVGSKRPEPTSGVGPQRSRRIGRGHWSATSGRILVGSRARAILVRLSGRRQADPFRSARAHTRDRAAGLAASRGAGALRLGGVQPLAVRVMVPPPPHPTVKSGGGRRRFRTARRGQLTRSTASRAPSSPSWTTPTSASGEASAAVGPPPAGASSADRARLRTPPPHGVGRLARIPRSDFRSLPWIWTPEGRLCRGRRGATWQRALPA